MIRSARIFPPLIALAMASVLAAAIPSSPSAEPVVAAPVDPHAVVTLDPLEAMLTALRPKAQFVGREGNRGYAILNYDLAYYLRAQPNGQVRISKADVQAVRHVVAASGWRI